MPIFIQAKFDLDEVLRIIRLGELSKNYYYSWAAKYIDRAIEDAEMQLYRLVCKNGIASILEEELFNEDDYSGQGGE